jgi:hypothetical protein
VHYNLKEYEDGIKSFQRSSSSRRATTSARSTSPSRPTRRSCWSTPRWTTGGRGPRLLQEAGRAIPSRSSSSRSIAGIYSKQDKTDDEVAVYEYLIGADKQAQDRAGVRREHHGRLQEARERRREDGRDEVINRFLTEFDPKSTWYGRTRIDEEAMTRANQYREEQLDWLISTWYHTHAQENDENSRPRPRRPTSRPPVLRAVHRVVPRVEGPLREGVLPRRDLLLPDEAVGQGGRALRPSSSAIPRASTPSSRPTPSFSAMEEKMFDAGVAKRPDIKPPPKGTSPIPRQGQDGGRPTSPTSRRIRTTKSSSRSPRRRSTTTEKAFLEACKAYVGASTRRTRRCRPCRSARPRSTSRRATTPRASSASRSSWSTTRSTSSPGFAAATLFDSNYRLRRWDQMERWARYMLERKNYEVLDKEQLEEVIAVSINNYATELKEKGGEGEKARPQQMLRFVKEFPEHPKAAIAMFNAAATSEQARADRGGHRPLREPDQAVCRSRRRPPRRTSCSARSTRVRPTSKRPPTTSRRWPTPSRRASDGRLALQRRCHPRRARAERAGHRDLPDLREEVPRAG